jgi:hypothetical protein
VVVGEAITVAVLVALKPVAGDQLYVVAPVAVNVALPPIQIGLGVLTATGGSGLTVTTILLVFKQLPDPYE